MTSDRPQPAVSAQGPAPSATEAFVWIWLQGALEPVIAGRIELDGGVYAFNYGRSYLALLWQKCIFEIHKSRLS